MLVMIITTRANNSSPESRKPCAFKQNKQDIDSSKQTGRYSSSTG